MNQIKRLLYQYNFIFEILFIYLWGCLLLNTDSYYTVYLLYAICGAGAVYFNKFVYHAKVIDAGKSIIITGILFSLSIIISNYPLFYLGLKGIGKQLVCGIGGFLIFVNLMTSISCYIEKRKPDSECCRLTSMRVFILCFLFITMIYGGYLISCGYPGNLDTDSFNYMNQIIKGNYSNHHPIGYTLIIKFWLTIGLRIWGDINKAVFLYSIFQVIVMVGIYSFIVATLYVRAGKKFAVSVLVWYAIMPFHIANSTTMWKDILFAGAVALFICALHRVLHHIGSLKYNILALTIGSYGFCLLRHNGWIAFCFTFAAFMVLYRKKFLRIKIILFIVICTSFFTNQTIIRLLKVEPAAIVDSLSIPAQQISRVIADGNEITKQQEAMLSNIMDVNKIKEIYLPYVSDPIKGEVYRFNNQEYIKNNCFDFLKLYIGIGIKYPAEYVKAWTDMTKGYWNGGYSYFKWINYVKENDLGIKRKVLISDADMAFEKWFSAMAKDNIFQPLISIGFHMWIVIALLALYLKRRNWNGFMLTVPIIAVFATLCIATPLDSEFRYIYSLFTSLPLILVELIRINSLEDKKSLT